MDVHEQSIRCYTSIVFSIHAMLIKLGILYRTRSQLEYRTS